MNLVQILIVCSVIVFIVAILAKVAEGIDLIARSK